MSSPAIRPPKNKPVAAPSGKLVSPQALRVLSEDGTARTAAPSIVMPRAKTELSELLAGDNAICLRRRASATASRLDAAAHAGISDAYARRQAESPTTFRDQPNPDGPYASPRAPTVDRDLACVIDAWPGLPQDVRVTILALIRETTADRA